MSGKVSDCFCGLYAIALNTPHISAYIHFAVQRRKRKTDAMIALLELNMKQRGARERFNWPRAQHI